MSSEYDFLVTNEHENTDNDLCENIRLLNKNEIFTIDR